MPHQALQHVLEDHKHKQTLIHDFVGSCYKHLQSTGASAAVESVLPSELDATLAELKRVSGPSTALGGLFAVSMARTVVGQERAPCSVPLLQFCLSASNVSRPGYNSFRAEMPDLPSWPTLNRHRDKFSDSPQSNITRLVQMAKDLQLPIDCWSGVLEFDDMNLQPGLLYCSRRARYAGYCTTTAFSIAAQVNDSTECYGDVAPRVGTYGTTFLFKSHCGKIWGPVATYYCADKSLCKDGELAIWSCHLIVLLAAQGFDCNVVVADGHKSIVVSDLCCATKSASGLILAIVVIADSYML